MAQRVGRAWRRAAVPRLSGAVLFANNLLARCRRAAMRLEPLQFLLAQRSKMVVMHRHAGRTENHFGVTLQTVVVRNETAHPAASKYAAPLTLATHAAPTNAVVLAAPAAQRTPRQDMPTASHRTAARIVNVALAVDAMAALHQAMPLAAQLAPSSATSPMAGLPEDMPTVRPRPGPPGAAVAEAQAPVVPADAPIARMKATVEAQALPPHEIERIAERVLGSIDRRILAERERRGRF